ncbi:peptide ABC transporter substrate-binding protein [Pediococcus inopinatus]|uniref:peptide ABC transporter substrate-binding protein n=1 Tax=Pediococcus inopinatus TaxID=114090 RepID=UPI0007093E57|nr:peptide ABC transporter substrate-binding protein [Pediococcus inopinatus]AVK99434.1 peptide-binding protein [Pediococcus inopinatus]KRN61373.1 abc-type oligopeptide transport system, periplasmic component [Pediococcus inopinatus]
MKVKKGWLVATFLVGALVLAGCGNSKANSGSSSKLASSYNYVYTLDPDNLDYTVSSRASNSDIYSNFEDGLLERNPEGQLKGALAKSWSVSKDGKTYTYHLRKGVKWVDSEGNDYADVKAQDFVTGLKHAVAAKSETLYVVQDSIKGLDDYVSGKTKDFSKVGIKATGKYTVQYTLNQPETYWNSKLTYGVMFPVNAKFLAQKGKDFGKAQADGILYNGPFVLSNFTSKSVIEFKKNSSYWDTKDVHLKTVKLTYNDGSNPDGLYKSFKSGDYTAARVYPSSAGYKDVVKQSKNNIIWSDQDASVYNFTFNLNRRAYSATSKKTSKAKANTKKAIWNRDFRLAVQFAFNKTNYAAQINGKSGANKALRNEMTPPSFVTIDGKDYGSQVETDLSKNDSDAFGSVNLADAQDGTYKPAKAKEYLAKALKTLKSEGVTGTIHLDLPVDEKSTTNLNEAKSFKNSVEKTLGKKNVTIDLQMLNEDKFNAATYAATTGAASDFDISNASGWSPDYDDPSSYLEIYNPESGSMLQTIGLDASSTTKIASDTAAVKAVGLDQYAKLLSKAEAITTDTNARYKAFAKAEAWLLNSGIQIPVYSLGGSPSVTKVVPYTKPYAQSGLGAQRYKYVKVQKKAVTISQNKKAKAAWTSKREKIAKAADNN